jgi:transposase
MKNDHHQPIPLRRQRRRGGRRRVRQSGGQPARHGRITKAGAAHARNMLVEAAWSASKAAGPLRAFYQRVQARRGMQIAAVATARKLTMLCWHLIVKGEDYAFAQPSLVAHKRRKLELRAGLPPHAGARAKRRPIASGSSRYSEPSPRRTSQRPPRS